ncbi:SusC/RagA family TonB-linked outer membrane protein [Niabella beijingensis]|uniref:SusC/RagA family TonB-linked outer membrane protein n=1 Tax=Niabella beijingensis TaxID=2872700 RepID=UPI001CBD8856|nr:SusC/RagA family TonB-linked outer membrane protein [Niabella beijingensis]MBZ4190682.1 SusC/RagA family TonB-linked outer membrane protein [Niabella beijingensis]
MRRILLLSTLLLVGNFLLWAQTKTITGTVKDESGNVIPFATVSEKGTKNAVSADDQGNFTITGKPGTVLEVSATGFQTRSQEVTTTPVNIVLTAGQGQTIQEVVVTAMGQTRTRNQVPFAAQQISGEQVSATRTNNFVNNLSGKVAGLEIRQNNSMGGSSNIILRGMKSITGNNQALFVVDGVPYSNSNDNSSDQTTGRGGYDYGNGASDLNPDDIETITVLKGAASSALYGSRGANGVIMITTKKAKKGLGITLNTGFGIGIVDKSTFAKYQKEYGAGYGSYYGPDGETYFNEFDVNGDGVNDLVVPTTEDASYGAPFDPNLLVYQWNAFDKTSPYYKKATPWVGAQNDPSSFFEKAFSSNQSILLNGGSDRGGFKLGYTRNDDKGILPNGRLAKNLLSFGGSYNINDKLTASIDGNFSNVEGKGRYGTGYDDKNLMTNFRQWWETNVDVKELKAAYDRTHKNTTWNWADPSTESGLVPIFWDNPYFTRYQNYESDSRNRIFGNVQLSYKVTDWLNLIGRVGLDSYSELQEERQAVGSIGIPSYRRINRGRTETNFDFLANFNKELSTDFDLKGLLGTNIRREHQTSINAVTNGGLAIPGIYSLSNSLNPLVAPVEFDGKREVDGVFANATLTWRNMLTLDGSIRRDASSTLKKGNNVYYYPSASLGFAFSELLKDATWLSYGKFRANYAEVGNDAPMQIIYDVYNILPPFDGRPQSTLPPRKNFSDLLPERTKSTELGLEMSFLQNRVGFDLAYYNAKSINQIIPLPVSSATFYGFKYMNAGTISNKGIELSVNGRPVRTSDFTWDVVLNWSKNKNNVEKLYGDNDNFVLASFQGGVSLNATVGQPFGTIRGDNFVYTNGQKTVGEDGYYLFSPTSNEVIGNPNPDWIGGLRNSFRYKNLSLSFLIDVRKGGDVYSLDMSYGLQTGLYPETAGLNDQGKPLRNSLEEGGGVVLPGVTEDGKPNTTRVLNDNDLYGAYFPQAAFIYDASYVKLREALLSYSFPNQLFNSGKFFKGIDVSLIGRNLWIIHKNVPYADPEEGISSGNLQGYQGGAYPTVRTITLNFKFKF